MAGSHILISVLALALGGIRDGVDGQLQKGVDMSDRAALGVCWYEYAKKIPVLPDNRKSTFGNCQMNMKMSAMTAQFIQQGADEQGQIDGVAQFMPDTIKQFLPEGYYECNNYLADPKKTYPMDMRNVLQDGGDPYPFRGFAHCLIGRVYKIHGDQAISDIAQRLQSDPNTPIAPIVVGRENEFRARHGAPPLQLDPVLTQRAQSWADGLAGRCQDIQLSDHITDDNPDDVYKGQNMGESIAEFGVMDNRDIALDASNSWYSEVKDYPFPAWQWQQGDPTFYKIGHFTAQVWKSSQLAGYAIGRRDGCDKVYVVARYWPSGNVEGPTTFAQNVGQYGERRRR